MNLVALNAELTNDPLGRNYRDLTDEQSAASLNTPDRQPNRETLDAGALVAAIVRSEYAALAAGDKDYLRLIAMAQSLPLTNTLRNELRDIFPAATATRDNLRALLKRDGTRAEELGLGRVTSSDVANARRL